MRTAMLLAALFHGCSLAELTSGTATGGGDTAMQSAAGGEAVGGSGARGGSGGGGGGDGTGGTDTGGSGGAALTYADVVLHDGPAAYWPMEDVAGGQVRDQIGDHDLLPVGNGIVSAEAGSLGFGVKLEMDGFLSLENLPASDALTLEGTSFTVEAWAVFPALQSDDRGIVSRFQAESLDALFGYSLYFERVGNAQQVRFAVYHGDDRTSRLDRTFVETDLVHIVATFAFDAVNGSTMGLFVNGVGNPNGRTNVPPLVQRNPLPRFVVGARQNGQAILQSVVDEVAIFPTALSPERIQAHFAAGTAARNEAVSTRSGQRRPQVHAPLSTPR